jgi:hypothetical protein
MLGVRAPNGVGKEKAQAIAEKATGHYYGHTPAYLLLQQYGYERWRKIFSFGFVRNPWDRLVSICARINPECLRSPHDFEVWLYNDCLDNLSHQHYVARGITIQRPCTDFLFPCTYVGRFETLKDDVARIYRLLGRGDIEWRHEEQREREPYRAYYTDAAHKWVRRRYHQDILNFGYRFEDGG